MSEIRCISPIDGSVVVARPPASLEAARAVIASARAAQTSWAARPLDERIALVIAGMEALGAMNDEIVPELARMMGRPVRYGGEFGGVEERIRHMASIAADTLADIEVGEDASFRRYIRRVPHGVVFVVAPWNYPYMTAINTIAPALIAGNAVVLKHATQTLLAGDRLAAAFHAGGVPEDLFVNLTLDHDTTSALIAERQFDFVNFTGSVGGGQAMERAAAGTFTGVGTELGGKDPGYVMDDADLGAAVATLVDAAMYNSRQCCCGSSASMSIPAAPPSLNAPWQWRLPAWQSAGPGNNDGADGASAVCRDNAPADCRGHRRRRDGAYRDHGCR